MKNKVRASYNDTEIDPGKAFGVGFILGMLLIVLCWALNSAFNPDIAACESSLPRDQVCVLVAVPQDKVNEVQ